MSGRERRGWCVFVWSDDMADLVELSGIEIDGRTLLRLEAWRATPFAVRVEEDGGPLATALSLLGSPALDAVEGIGTGTCECGRYPTSAAAVS